MSKLLDIKTLTERRYENRIGVKNQMKHAKKKEKEIGKSLRGKTVGR